MIPIAKHFDPVLGIDIHILTIPPVGPVPIPHPHIGIVFDPIDYVPVLGSTVMVNGIPRATAGTTGKPVPHIPLGGPFAMPPGNEDELFMGSTTVLADSAPLSFAALPVLSCQSVGMIAPIRMKKPKKTYGMTLPTTVVMPIPAGLPVLVGGPPTIDMMSLGMSLGLAGLGKAFKKFKKSKLGKKLGKKFKKAKQKACKNMKPGFIKCKVLKAEPVNAITGEVVVEQADFNIDGRIPIEWSRYYGSQNTYRGVCGNGWETPADIRLEIDSDGQALFYEGGPGARVFPHLPEDSAMANAKHNGHDAVNPDKLSVTELVDGAVLTLHKGRFTVRTREGKSYQFQQSQNSFAKRRPQATTLLIEKIFDDYNNHLLFVRDQYDQLLRVEESAGRALIATSKEGLLRKLEFYHPEEKQLRPLVRYEYDNSSNLTAVFDALDSPYRFEYRYDLLIRHTDRNGLSFYYDYDLDNKAGKCVHAWGDDGLYNYHFEYQPQVTVFVNSLSQKSWIEFDENNLPLKERDELGLKEAYEYDSVGRMSAVANGGGERTEYHYDNFGNLLEVVRADGSVIRTEYDEYSNPIRIQDPNGNVWLQVWTKTNKLIRQITPMGAVTQYGYDQFGLVCTVEDALHNAIRIERDFCGIPSAFIDELGNTTYFECDCFGNVVKEVNASGRILQYEYDAKSRLVSSVNPSGTALAFQYDPEGNLTQYRDENGNTTCFEYSGIGEISKRIQPDKTEVLYERNTEEQLIGIVNERRQKYQFKRDQRGRIIEEKDYWGCTTRYFYGKAGYLEKRIDPLGRETRYSYDSLGRLTKKILFDGVEETFEYDSNGNLISHENPNSKCERIYDLENRILRERQGDLFLDNKYDAVGNRIERTSSFGNRISYKFDAGGLVQQITINNEPPFNIKRDSDGLIIRESFALGLSRHYEYTRDGFVSRQMLNTGAESVADIRYSYDPVGNLTGKTDFRTGQTYFTYDPMGRIIKTINPVHEVEEFLFDPAGDLMKSDHSGSLDDAYRYAYYRDLRFTYDAAGNLVSKRTSSLEELQFVWDGNNRLAKATDQDANETEYAYDSQGRRVCKIRNDKKVVFLWDGDELLADIDNTGKVREFVYYPDSFEPLALISQADVSYYHNDINGAPTQIISSSGVVIWSALYNCTGGLEGDIGIDNPIRLQGQYYDDETGLHYNRFRYYDPEVGSFISKDPLGLYAGANLYWYGPNSYGWADPYGLNCAKVDNGVLKIKNKFPKGSKEAKQLEEFVKKWNAQIAANGGSMTRQRVSKSQRRKASKFAEAEKKANPSKYSNGEVAGHISDVGWGGKPNGPFMPLDPSVNSYVGGATQAVAPGTSYTSVLLE